VAIRAAQPTDPAAAPIRASTRTSGPRWSSPTTPPTRARPAAGQRARTSIRPPPPAVGDGRVR